MALRYERRHLPFRTWYHKRPGGKGGSGDVTECDIITEAGMPVVTQDDEQVVAQQCHDVDCNIVTQGDEPIITQGDDNVVAQQCGQEPCDVLTQGGDDVITQGGDQVVPQQCIQPGGAFLATETDDPFITEDGDNFVTEFSA